MLDQKKARLGCNKNSGKPVILHQVWAALRALDLLDACLASLADSLYADAMLPILSCQEGVSAAVQTMDSGNGVQLWQFVAREAPGGGPEEALLLCLSLCSGALFLNTASDKSESLRSSPRAAQHLCMRAIAVCLII